MTAKTWSVSHLGIFLGGLAIAAAAASRGHGRSAARAPKFGPLPTDVCADFDWGDLLSPHLGGEEMFNPGSAGL